MKYGLFAGVKRSSGLFTRSGLYPIVLLTCFAGGLSYADQNDPRLDGLFETLRSANSAADMALAENQIWRIWMQHPNEDVEQLMALGSDAMSRGDLPQAMRVFSQIINLYPDYAEAWNKRATLHYLAGDYSASLADIEKTLALEPRHFGALSGLGLVQLSRDELVAARDAFQRLLQVHPNSPNGRSNLDQVETLIQRNTI